MEWNSARNLLCTTAAAALALPLICVADDRDADKSSSSTTTERSTESRSSVTAKSQANQTTLEGRIISLHQYMTNAGSSATSSIGASRTGASATAARASTAGSSLELSQGPLALETSSGLVLLSDPHASTVGAASSSAKTTARATSRADQLDDNVAGIDRDASDSDASDGGATASSRVSTKEPSDVSLQGRINNTAAAAQSGLDDSGVYGIERADLDKAGQRVKATGTLYTKGGIRYMVVSSVTTAGPGAGRGDSSLNRDADSGRDSGSESPSRDAGSDNDPNTGDNNP